MHRKPTLAAVMTPFPYAVDVEAPLDEAGALMKRHAIHHLPVTQAGVIVGVISARDLGVHARPEWRVREVYQPDPYVADMATPLEEVLMMMVERHIGSVIVTRHDKLAGILTHIDVCRSFAAMITAHFPTPPDDLAA